jgi:hypothetical protein
MGRDYVALGASVIDHPVHCFEYSADDLAARIAGQIYMFQARPSRCGVRLSWC